MNALPTTSKRREDALTFPTLEAARQHAKRRERETGCSMRAGYFNSSEAAIVVGIDSWLSVEDGRPE